MVIVLVVCLDNPTYVFTVKASVRSSHLNVSIEPVKSEETSDMILLNCTHNNNDVTCRVYLITSVDREVYCFVFALDIFFFRFFNGVLIIAHLDWRLRVNKINLVVMP